METWALIYNPASGNFRPRMLDAVDAALRGAGVRTERMPTGHPGHATELAREAHGVSRVAVYGGDGTLNEAANGLLGRELPLVFLPGGTANVMAWEIGLTVDPVRAALAQARSRPRPMWPGLVDERCFLLMAGFGFDGDAVHGVTPRMKGWLGRGAYVLSGVRALLRHQPRIHIQADNGAAWQGSWVVATRARHYGGRFSIHPTAGLQHGALGLVVVSAGRIVPFLTRNLGLGAGRSGPGVVLEERVDFRIACDAPVHVQVDGDYHGRGSAFAIRIASRPLLLCFPWGGSGA